MANRKQIKKKKSQSCHRISDTLQKRGKSAQISLRGTKVRETPYNQVQALPALASRRDGPQHGTVLKPA